MPRTRCCLAVRIYWQFAAMIVAHSALLTAPVDAAPPDPTATTAGTIRIRTEDASGAPMSGVQVIVSIWSTPSSPRQEATTPASGEVDFDLPQSLELLRIWATADGHVPLIAEWHPEVQTNASSVPAEFTFRLEPGTVVGGVVTDELGDPIVGAKVSVQWRPNAEPPRDKRPVFSHSLGVAVTDAAGRWSLNNAPEGVDFTPRLLLSHPQYIGDRRWGELQEQQRITLDALRAQTAAIVLQRGVLLTGTVRDDQGAPVRDAVVIWGDDPYRQVGGQETTTDENGVYQFTSLPAGKLAVTVVAQGWAPDRRTIDLQPGIGPVDFDLRRGNTLRIRFVDNQGAPIPRVYVSIDEWRGAKSLYNHKHSSVIDTKIPARSDAAGRYVWTWAPEDAVKIGYEIGGYVRDAASLVAGQDEHVVVIHPPLRITGAVTDAATGQPVRDFIVVPVIHFTEDFAFLARQEAVAGSDGRFEFEFDRADITHGVQIEAPGYFTFRTDERYAIGGPNPELHVRLEAAERHRGRVVDRDGRPVPAARVYVATAVQHLDLYNLNEDELGNSNYRVTTDAEGVFEIVPQSDRYALAVIAEQGFARVDRVARQAPGELRVEQWAQIKGRVVQSGQAMPGCRVYLDTVQGRGGDTPRVTLNWRTETNSAGAFAFDRAPPGPCYVHPYLHFSSESPLQSALSLPLNLEPGAEADVDLGAGGAEVVGQLVIEGYDDADFDYHFALNYLVARRGVVDPPASLAEQGFETQLGWSDAWRSTAEGQAYLTTRRHWFVKPDPDGRICISGVEPGEYDLAIALYGTTEGCLIHPLGERVLQITVDEQQQALDLGRIVVPALRVPRVGDEAADFEFTQLGGEKASLAKLRGKYVLLDFWATWCGPCVAKLGEVERLRQQIGGGDRLVVIGCNLDADPQQVAEFLAKRQLPWRHALLGEWSTTNLPQQFAVAGLPTYVLIDPQGRIAAHEVSLDPIAKKLIELLDVR